MAETFDPYRKWLGIPPAEQPPNLYRLLGIGLFEADPDVISNASDRQMVHVRTFQSGKYSNLSQKLLNELSAARVALLDPKKKAEYDEQLRKEMASKMAVPRPVAMPIVPAAVPAAQAVVATPVAGPTVVPSAVPIPPAPPAPTSPSPVAVTTRPPASPPPVAPPAAASVASSVGFAPQPLRTSLGPYATKEKRTSDTAWQMPAIIGGIIVVLAIFTAIWIFSGPGAQPSPSTDDSAQNTQPTEPVKAETPRTEKSTAHTELPAKKPSEPKPVATTIPRTKPDIPAITSDPADIIATMGGDSQAKTPSGADAIGEIRAFTGHKGRVRSVVFTSKGTQAVSGGDDQTVRLWDVESAREVRRFEGPKHPIRAVACSPDGQFVAAITGTPDTSGSNELFVWNITSAQPTASVKLDGSFFANDVKFVPQTAFVALAGRNHSTRLFDLGTKKEARSYSKNTEPITCVACSPDGSLLLTGSDDHSLCLWNVGAGNLVKQLHGHNGPVVCAMFSGDGNWAASAGKDRAILVWSIPAGAIEQRLEKLDAAITSVAFSLEHQYLVAGGEDGVLRLFDPVKGKEVRRFPGHEGIVLDVDCSRVQQRAISAGADGTLRLWGLPAPAMPVVEKPKPPVAPVDAPATPKRWPVPGEIAAKEADEALQTGPLKDDFEQADRPSRKTALARKLVELGNQANAPTAAYAPLKWALDVGTEHGDTELAFAAIDGLGRKFEVEPISMKVETMETVLKAKAASVSANRVAWIEKILALCQEATIAGKFDAAERLLLTARNMVKAVRNSDTSALSKAIAAHTKEIEDARRTHALLKGVTEALKANPEDPQAHLAMGKFLCGERGDWTAALPHLVRGSDTAWKFAAENDLANPELANQQYNLANSWWILAEQATGRTKEQLRFCAAYWYEKAEPKLFGGDLEQAQARLKEIGGRQDAGGETDAKDDAAKPAEK